MYVKNGTGNVVKTKGLGTWQSGQVREVPDGYCYPRVKVNGGVRSSVVDDLSGGKLTVLQGTEQAPVVAPPAAAFEADGHSAGVAAVMAEGTTMQPDEAALKAAKKEASIAKAKATKARNRAAKAAAKKAAADG